MSEELSLWSRLLFSLREPGRNGKPGAINYTVHYGTGLAGVLPNCNSYTVTFKVSNLMVYDSLDQRRRRASPHALQLGRP
jgi:hypothetical protein